MQRNLSDCATPGNNEAWERTRLAGFFSNQKQHQQASRLRSQGFSGEALMIISRINRSFWTTTFLFLLCAFLVKGAALPPSSDVARVTILQEPGGRVSWSHARDVIALDKPGADGYSDVYTVRPDGADLRCLTCGKPEVPQLHNGQPVWHPSGAYIVFQAQDPNLRGVPSGLLKTLAGPGIGINNNLWMMTADGSRFWPLTHVADRLGVLHPQFSHDGAQLLWSEMISPDWDRVGRWAMKLADVAFVNGEPRLWSTRTLRPGNLQLYETHGFSPDGQKIIFSGIPEGKYYYDMEIFTFDLVTGRLEQLTNNDEWDEHAHFTPDGRQIVWATSEGIPQIKQVTWLKLDYWIMNADGSNKRRLTGFNNPSAVEYLAGRTVTGDFDWAADGKIIAAYLIRERVGVPLNDLTVLIKLDDNLELQPALCASPLCGEKQLEVGP
jgi:hypothetical protein